MSKSWFSTVSIGCNGENEGKNMYFLYIVFGSGVSWSWWFKIVQINAPGTIASNGFTWATFEKLF
jgi:hypothetical protein